MGAQMKPLVAIAALAALIGIPGCLQSVPEPYLSAPQQQMVGGNVLLQPDSGPNPAHVVRSGSRVIGADPDPLIRAEMTRNMQCYDTGCD